jgi:hypothetical protein
MPAALADSCARWRDRAVLASPEVGALTPAWRLGHQHAQG